MADTSVRVWVAYMGDGQVGYWPAYQLSSRTKGNAAVGHWRPMELSQAAWDVIQVFAQRDGPIYILPSQPQPISA